MDRIRLLEQLNKDYPKYDSGHDYSILLEKCFNYLRENGSYDFHLEQILDKLYLYVAIYNNKGEFINYRLWGTYNTVREVLHILRNIIRFET